MSFDPEHNFEVEVIPIEIKSRSLPDGWRVQIVTAPKVNPFEGWTIEEDNIDDETWIGCDEDGNIDPDLLASFKVWEKAYHDNNYDAAKKAVTDNG